MKLSELIAEVKRYGFGTGTGHSDDTIKALINTSQSEILSAATWPFAQRNDIVVVEPDSNIVTAPEDLSKLEAVYLSTGSTKRKLVRVSPLDFLELEASQTATGSSLYYSVFS